MSDKQHRPLSVIASEIMSDWKKPYFGAVPYIEAMTYLRDMDGAYYHDSADDIVRRFLLNSGRWHGETARRIKAELKDMIK